MLYIYILVSHRSVTQQQILAYIILTPVFYFLITILSHYCRLPLSLIFRLRWDIIRQTLTLLFTTCAMAIRFFSFHCFAFVDCHYHYISLSSLLATGFCHAAIISRFIIFIINTPYAESLIDYHINIIIFTHWPRHCRLTYRITINRLNRIVISTMWYHTTWNHHHVLTIPLTTTSSHTTFRDALAVIIFHVTPLLIRQLFFATGHRFNNNTCHYWSYWPLLRHWHYYFHFSHYVNTIRHYAQYQPHAATMDYH
jgi:hypothetical protein